ncbi:hypothetical protein Taro_056289, partial [Colocasia esculenta]|nr:hypothetical protein [Colocasia esculenta]
MRIAPRRDVSSRNSATPRVPRSTSHSSIPVRTFKNTRARSWGKRERGLASTPLSPTCTANINVHNYCRQVHDVNVHEPRRQQSTTTSWPPTQTEQQQVLFQFTTHPALHLLKPRNHTMHSTHPTHTGLTTAATTTMHMIRMDPKSTR